MIRAASLQSLACLAFGGALAAQVTVSTNGTANGIQMTTGSALGASGSQVSIFAMGGSVLRGEINNAGTGPQLIAIWPCSSAGCIPYAANSTGFGETGLLLGAQGLPLLAGSSTSGIPQWGATNSFLDLQANAVTSEFTNYGTAPGTTLNELASLTNGSQVTTAAASAANGIEGICVAGCGTASSPPAQIAREGIASCLFDDTSAIGDYVQASPTAGECHDAGSTYPTNGSQVVGRILSNVSGATYRIILYPPLIGSQYLRSSKGSRSTHHSEEIFWSQRTQRD